MLWRGKVQISGNLLKQPFSKVSGRITLKTAYENIFIPENPQILGCRFLDALVLIRGFLLYLNYIPNLTRPALIYQIIKMRRRSSGSSYGEIYSEDTLEV